ncbi:MULTISPECIES: ubiquitin-like protein Pup [unclassified Corynebacterium]|uniref:ubiquitin-like protein Pup n=1 Tax=unclassified Corynebacterium TaxID=2624378 RepID=UPI0029CA5C35|nr:MULTISPECIES: ubiquitin-like protein Pup [unclassified Corynebacterium]WPF67189.1 ubiquitin-like protein Pup [Corynebacterium sp. 22KM0430]WPF69678.1 ubiquitin-like protein Pup [Corynebacterium sp. 21KM1197]
MSEHTHLHRNSGGNQGEPGDDAFAAAQVQINTQGTDDLLHEIDGLLEDNAEEFVNSYVQKGGQ